MVKIVSIVLGYFLSELGPYIPHSAFPIPNSKTSVLCHPTSDLCKTIRWAAATELLYGRIWQRYLVASANVSVWWFSWSKYDCCVIF